MSQYKDNFIELQIFGKKMKKYLWKPKLKGSASYGLSANFVSCAEGLPSGIPSNFVSVPSFSEVK